MFQSSSSCQHASRGLFIIGDDCLVSLLSWLDVCSLCILDKAVAVGYYRLNWLRCLRAMEMKTIDAYEHCHSSLRWVLGRGMPVTMIRVREYSRNEITTKTFEGIACPSIVSIDIHSCHNVATSVLMSLATGCPQLSSINLYGCRNITDAGVSAVAQGCPLVSRINLNLCRNITDAGVSAVAQGCPLLSSINFHGCIDITDAGVSAVAQGCPQLSSITLYGCNITDTGVIALRLACPLLRSH